MDIRDIFRVGKVSSVNGANCTARVTFPDKDDMVSAELPVIVPGSYDMKEYHLPRVKTQVLCCFLPNASGRGMNDGFIIGGFYSTENPPADTDPEVYSLRMPDGSYIKFDGAGNLEIHATGNITITGANVFINE